MSEKQVTGHCLCGAVHYVAKGEPSRVGLCHCETCRRNTGAPVAGFAVFPRDQVEISGGETGSYKAPDLTRHFCTTCGSAVFIEELSDDGIAFHIGTLDDVDSVSPAYQLWSTARAGWLSNLDKLTKYEHGRDSPTMD